MWKVTVVGGVVDFVLGIAKIMVGWMANSQALVADGVHSLSDLGTDFIVLYAAKHSHKEADEDHPYGHGRIETIATIGLGVTLMLVAFGIAYDSVQRMNDPASLLVPGVLALVIALISVFAKEAIYHYTKRAARRLRSNLLMANAWHSRSDAISSIVVVIGVLGAMTGYTYLDAVAAVTVAVMIAKIGFDLVRASTRELIDTALEPEVLDRVREKITAVNGVRAIHMLRSRSSGGHALLDVHIQVDPRLSVSEGHQIGDSVRHGLIDNIDEITDVTVHIDPEDDELESPCTDLPLRYDLLQRLEAEIDDLPGVTFEKVTLHYLYGSVQVDLVLPMSVIEHYDSANQLVSKITEVAQKVPEIGKVRVSFTV